MAQCKSALIDQQINVYDLLIPDWLGLNATDSIAQVNKCSSRTVGST